MGEGTISEFGTCSLNMHIICFEGFPNLIGFEVNNNNFRQPKKLV